MNWAVRAEVEGRVSEGWGEARSMLGDQEGKKPGVQSGWVYIGERGWEEEV